MKYRTGFVSNSSSSSFVVILPRSPESAQDVESIFFPNGYEDPYDDEEDEPVTAASLAKVLWDDIVEQRKIPDVQERLLDMCASYAIRGMEDALQTMWVSVKDQQRILQIPDDDEANSEFVQLILDKARQYGATMGCFPAHDTVEVYCLSYGSGNGPEHQALFGNINFIEHLPFIAIMES